MSDFIFDDVIIDERVQVGMWTPELKAIVDRAGSVPMMGGSVPSACPNCGGYGVVMVYETGRYIGRSADGSKCKWLEEPWVPKSGWYAGEMRYAPCPVCKSNSTRNYITRRSGLVDSDLRVSLSDFVVRGQAAQKAPALAAVRELLGQNEEPGGFVTLVGGYGVGKSHLLKGLVTGFIGINVHCHYTTLSDLIANVREKFGDNNPQSVEQAIQYFRGLRVLAIDEIDRVNLTGWVKELIHRLLDRRYNERSGLLTVMATNTNPRDFPPDLGYLASRCTGGEIITVPGPDMRPILAGAK